MDDFMIGKILVRCKTENEIRLFLKLCSNFKIKVGFNIDKLCSDYRDGAVFICYKCGGGDEYRIKYGVYSANPIGYSSISFKDFLHEYCKDFGNKICYGEPVPIEPALIESIDTITYVNPSYIRYSDISTSHPYTPIDHSEISDVLSALRHDLEALRVEWSVVND